MVRSGKQPSQFYNHLIQEKSPYLLQHADNPVDWYPWNEEAFRQAQEKDRPIFLSIGYATCHWCHVMAHESFEDEEVARLLNQSFVSIKVDREERPDIDQVYMSVCQALTGQGGWPLSIFMTPEGNPFFAGTYFPKDNRTGRVGFTVLLTRIASLWQKDREKILHSSAEIRRAIQQGPRVFDAGVALDAGVLKKAYEQMQKSFDQEWGGFSRSPKFPTPHHLTFLLRWHKRSQEAQAGNMVEKTLKAMRHGGIFDQIGLGFHRYSVDERWLVPHFEKMLYDQALLAMAYTEAYQALGKAEYAGTVREIFSYVLRDMTSPEGGFFSAEDADSEGQEGLFYVWTPREVKKHLGEKMGGLFCRFFGITPEGNFEEGTSIPHISVPLPIFAGQEKMDAAEIGRALQSGKKKLFEAREKRVHPLKDDKIISSWNGLMIAALAKGAQALQDDGYTRAARRAADFFLAKMRNSRGRLYRRYRHGHIAYPGFLDDYAYLVWGLIELYEATFEVRYLEQAVHLNQIMIELFGDEEKGGFYFTGQENELLIARPKEIYDGAVPSGNSVAALNLLRLARMTGDVTLEKKADQLLQFFSSAVAAVPMACTQLLMALDFVVGPSKEIVIAGDPQEEMTRAMIALLQRRFVPNKVVLLRREGEAGKELTALSPFVAGMVPVGKKPAVYLCEGYTCRSPLTDVAALKNALP
ncbi:MAG: thioredoxin domain-containing protein [Deltaproteobacteria bacterium]|nr:thioredoxin domain-containing protein [Deltaproteobacteria bacterium]